MVETVGNAPTATILQGSSAPLCCPPWCPALVSIQPFCAFNAAQSPDLLTGRTGADGGNRTRLDGVALRGPTNRPRPQRWWEADGIEPLARRDRVYSAATAPACPYGTSRVWLRAPGLHRAIAAYETAWVPNRPTRANGAKAFNSLACCRYFRGQQKWRMPDVSIATPFGAVPLRTGARGRSG